MNILINATQAIDGTGMITIRTGTSGDSVWISITDSGKGIPEEHLSRVFDTFFTTKPVGVGTGLGLSLCYGIVKRHHGQITVDSQPGLRYHVHNHAANHTASTGSAQLTSGMDLIPAVGLGMVKRLVGRRD